MHIVIPISIKKKFIDNSSSLVWDACPKKRTDSFIMRHLHCKLKTNKEKLSCITKCMKEYSVYVKTEYSYFITLN